MQIRRDAIMERAGMRKTAEGRDSGINGGRVEIAR
jgi:hypothetical protein